MTTITRRSALVAAAALATSATLPVAAPAVAAPADDWRDAVLLDLLRFVGTLPEGDYPPMIALYRLLVRATPEAREAFAAELPILA